LASELKKCFRVGDHVKVIGGHYEGDTGLIVRVEENIVVLFSDLTMHEVHTAALSCRQLPITSRSNSSEAVAL
jgi:transcription elongation factor